ncbi:MAG: hypothetical protein Q9178_003043 [Gyalolechia marmorata]
MDQGKPESHLDTQILAVDVRKLGDFIFDEPNKSFLGDWDIHLSKDSQDANHLLQAANLLKTSSLPVAFPTETVYGLGADATRSDAVAGIYAAKQRPADNPLIVHISSLRQLRRLLGPNLDSRDGSPDDVPHGEIPAIYESLISRFWPGPLTILLPLPKPSPLAQNVTCSLSTMAVRMPSSRLALALIHLAGVPLAAPSANASTKPSPTTAAHVLHDLSGRIPLIIGGGPCKVGVESTVVDGLSNPPVILRPGAVSIEMLRQCPGWEGVAVGYRDSAETTTTTAPRAPGMKYKHYSPKARVILVHGQLSFRFISRYLPATRKIGLVRTMTWRDEDLEVPRENMIEGHQVAHSPRTDGFLRRFSIETLTAVMPKEESGDRTSMNGEIANQTESIHVSSITLGNEAATIAQGLFSALRELDLDGVDVIFVEAIIETKGDEAAAVMNRLRKAAEIETES